jgi:hypothetical protein
MCSQSRMIGWWNCKPAITLILSTVAMVTVQGNSKIEVVSFGVM